MSVEWTAVDNTIENIEGSEIDGTFSCSTNPEEGHSVRINVLSSTLPTGIETRPVFDGINLVGFEIYGVLPQIINETTYYVTARLEEYNDNTIFYYADKYFKVINKVSELRWTKPLSIDCYESTEFSFSIKDAKYEENGVTKYYISGLNGDEVFRKVSGSLPRNITLHSNGILSGTPLRSDVEQSFDFNLSLYRNDELVLDPATVRINVRNERKDIPPTWITESGILDTVNAGDTVDIKIIAVINTDESDEPLERIVSYKLIDGELPTGLTLSSSNNQGIISGVLTTSEIKEWAFSICTSRYYQGRNYPELDPTSEYYNTPENQQMIENSTRTFSIKTNEASPEHRIDWNGDDKVIDVGSYPIGTVINQKIPLAVAADGSVVKYTVIDNGTFPTNIKIGANGSLTGLAEFPRGEFECYVRAYTDYTYVTKRLRIKITKGLGKNALRLSLRINLEYKNDFLELKDQLNTSAAYGMNQEGYNIDVFPKIDVATLTCFDREILAGIFNFGAPEIVRLLETRYKTYSDVDLNGDAIETYEAYYKAIDENTYQWDAINNGNFDFESQKEKQIEETDNFSGKTDLPYFYPMEESSLSFNNKTAQPNPLTQKQWVRDDQSGSVYYKIGNVNIDNGLDFKIFNIKNVREMLQKYIYVYKKLGSYYYDLGCQRLFEKTGISLKKIYEKEYKDTDIDEIRIKYFMSNMDGSNEEEVQYVYQDWNDKHYVYNLYDVLQTNILFTPSGKYILNEETDEYTLDTSAYDGHPFMIESIDNIYYLEEITDPWCLDKENEKNNWISLSSELDGYEMVLPRITDDDIELLQEHEGNGSVTRSIIQMLDTSVEPLPKWKRKEYKYWEAETTFDVGDIVYYDSKYYLIIKKYTTDYGFEYNTEYMKELENDEIKERLEKEYIPSLDIGYYKSGKNRIHLKALNKAEKEGKFWYRKDFLFWEVTCTPVYNSTIETFGVPFYSFQVDNETSNIIPPEYN